MKKATSTCLFLAVLLALACAMETPTGDGGSDESFEVAEQAATSTPGALGYAGGARREGGEPPPGAAPAPATVPDARPVPADRKLVRTVHLVFTVDAPETAADRAQELAAEAGGYVASVEAVRRDGLLHYKLTLRVPGERLDAVLAALEELAAEVEREQVSTEDVTDRYVDLEARLRALRATEEELTALLRESRSRGHSAEDIMAIFRELTGIRSQIEQLQGQLQLLANRVAFSTVHLELRPTAAARPLVDEGWSPGSTAHSSVRALLAALQWLADAAIVLAVAVLPVLLIVLVPLWLLLRLLVRLRARRRAAGSTTGSPPASD